MPQSIVNGWTVVTPSSDSRLIYVSNTGNDTSAANNQHGRPYYLPSDPEIGLDPTDPVGPILAFANPIEAAKYVRGATYQGDSPDGYPDYLRGADASEGYPDWFLLRRGQTHATTFNYTHVNTGEPRQTNVGAFFGRWYWARPDHNNNGLTNHSGGHKGRSETEPFVMTAWGPESDPRPILDGLITISGSHQRFMSFVAKGANFAQEENSWETTFGEMTDLLIEDCRFTSGMGGMTTADFKNAIIRRCVTTDNFNPDSHNHGLFVNYNTFRTAGPAVGDELTIEECVFDRNGYKEDPNEPTTWSRGIDSSDSRSVGQGVQPARTVYDRNLYLSGYLSMTLRGNIFSRGGGGGDVQMRAGGVCERNLFLMNAQGLVMGSKLSYDDYQHAGLVVDNVFLHDEHFVPPGASSNAFAFEWHLENLVVSDNIVTGYMRSGGSWSIAQMIGKRYREGRSPAEPAKLIAFLDNDIHSNGGKYVFWIDDDPVTDILDLRLKNNNIWRGAQLDNYANFQSSITVSAFSEAASKTTGDPWDVSNNNYASGISPLTFNLYGSGVVDLVGWQNAGFDLNSVTYADRQTLSSAVGWNDPDRSILSYMQLVDPTYSTDENVYVDDGTSGTNQTPRQTVWENLEPIFGQTVAKDIAKNYHAFLSFIDKARNNYKGNWDTRWTAEEVNNYIRGGFGKASITGPYTKTLADIENYIDLVSHGPVTQLTLTTQPSGGTSGDVLPSQPVVVMRDADNLIVSSDNTTQVTAAIQSGVNGTLTGTTTVTVVNGIATFTDLVLTGDAGENYVLRFSIPSPALHVDSNPVVLTPIGGEENEPKSINIITQPSPNYSNLAFITQPVVAIVDANESVNTNDNSTVVTATLNGSNGVLIGTANATAVNGIVSFTNLGINGDPNQTYSLTFESGGLNSATSSSFSLLFDEPVVDPTPPLDNPIRPDRYIRDLLTLNIDGDFNRGDILSLRANQTMFLGTGIKDFIVDYRNTILNNRTKDYNIPEDWDVFWHHAIGPIKNPNQIAPCFAWYKPEFFTASSDGVTYTGLTNKALFLSDDPDDFEQTTASQQAGRTSYGLNGFIPLSFDGTDDYYVNAEDTDRFHLPINVDFIFGFVMTTDAVSTGDERAIFSQGRENEDGSFQIIKDETNSLNKLKFVTQWAGQVTSTETNPSAYTSGESAIVTISRINDTMILKVNGAVPGFPILPTVPPINSVTTSTNAFIGAVEDLNDSTIKKFFNGDLYELVLFKEDTGTELTSSHIEELEGYLAAKYKMQSALPSSHPYNDNSPRASVLVGPLDFNGTLPSEIDCGPTRVDVTNTTFDDTSHTGEQVDVFIAPKCEWQATTNDSWITLTTPYGIGDGSFTFDVAAHTGQADRNGSIIITTIDGSVNNISLTQTSAAAWTPSNLGNLAAWWKADDLTGSNASSVTAWNDAHGSTNLSGTATLYTNVQNGLNTVRFNGTTDELTVGNNTLLSGAAGMYIFAVAKNDGNASQFAFSWDDTDGILRGYVGTYTANTSTTLMIANASQTTAARFRETASGLTSFAIYGIWCDGTDVQGRINGTDINTSPKSFSGGTVATGTSPGLGIGSGLGTLYWDGDVGEVVLGSANLTDSEAHKVEGYLAHKWGLAGNLPAGHPYKNAAP